MRAAGVPEVRMLADPGPALGHAGIGPQVDVLMLDGSPQALDKDVVSANALTIYAVWPDAGFVPQGPAHSQPE